MVESIKNDFKEAYEVLCSFMNDDNMLIIDQAARMMAQSIQEGNKILSCGNGGSLCDAMHFTEELTGRFRNTRKPIPALSVSDSSHITCVGNDYGYEYVFSRFIEALGNEGDILLAISTSGNSLNVLNAVIAAKAKGLKVVALTGKSGGKIGELCDVEVRAPFSEYSDRTQEIHIKVIHTMVHAIEEILLQNLFNVQ